MVLLRQVEGQWGVSPKAGTGPLLTIHLEPASLDRIKHATFLSQEKWKLEHKSLQSLRLLDNYIKLQHAHAMKVYGRSGCIVPLFHNLGTRRN
jgi:hypothetical protein